MAATDEPSGMTAERVRSLEAIGFQWTVSENLVAAHADWPVWKQHRLSSFCDSFADHRPATRTMGCSI